MMTTITRTLAALAAAALTSLGGITSALAGPVMPLVSNPSALALTTWLVPLDVTGFEVADLQSVPPAEVAKNVTNGGAEQADGAAKVTLDTGDINASVVKSRSQVSTVASSADPDPTQRMRDGSTASFSATLSTIGLASDGTATVDLRLIVSGSLIYADPGGGATTAEDPFFGDLVSDMSANVSVILAVAAATTPIPNPPPLVPLFNGSATLRAPMAAGNEPDLIREGSWESRPGDFTPVVCDALMVCRVDVTMTLLFEDAVQSLGFGETFDIGLILLTNADAISDTGRMAASLFFDSASVEVTLTALDAQVPEPETLLLLATGMLVLAATRRRGGRRRA